MVCTHAFHHAQPFTDTHIHMCLCTCTLGHTFMHAHALVNINAQSMTHSHKVSTQPGTLSQMRAHIQTLKHLVMCTV